MTRKPLERRNKMKKIICLILAAVMVMALAVNSFAFALYSSDSIGNNAMYEFNDKTGELVIHPEDSTKEAKCTVSFFNHGEIQSVIIKEGITEIGEEAFENCKNLKSVRIENGLKYIGKSAFEDCANLESVEFPETLENIDYDSFSDCSNLSCLVFRGNKPNIKGSVFTYLGKEKEVDIYTKNGWTDNLSSIYHKNFKFHNLSDYHGSTFSEGDPGIITAVGACAIFVISVSVLAMKKKKAKK